MPMKKANPERVKVEAYKARIEVPVTPQRVHELRLALKRDWHRGLRGVAIDLGISDTMLVLIEQGKREITPKFAEAFLELERSWQNDPDLEHQRKRDRAGVITLISAFPLPRRLEVLQVIHCRRCKKDFTPRRTGQVEHPRGMCKRVVRRRRKK